MASVRKAGVRYWTCSLCEASCGLRVEVSDGRIVSIRGDQEDPLSRGHVCPKAPALRDLQGDPDRLRQPVRRTATGWEGVTWASALDEAAERLHAVQRTHGRDAVATYLGSPTAHDHGALLFAPLLLRTLGSRNRFSAASLDQLPHMLAARLMMGHQLLVPVPDLDRTRHLLIIGANPLVSNGSMMTAPDVRRRLRAIRERGGKIVVVDPRRTETARAADEHVFIRPGTDAPFLLAALREVLDCGARLRHLARLSDDLDTLRRAVQEFTAERAAAHCGIPADVIRRLSREFLEADSAVAYGRFGASTQPFGALCQWAILALNACSGNLDREGGAMFTLPAFDVVRGPRLLAASPGGFGRWRTRVRGLPEFAGELPAAALAEEILTEGDGRVRGLLTFAGNPVLSAPNGTRLDRALGTLDFMVSIDPYVNETTRHAHLVLPPTTPLERSRYDPVFLALAVRNVARYSPPVLRPPAGALHDWQILLELRRRLERLRGTRRVAGAVEHLALRRLGPDGLLDVALRAGPYGGGLNALRGLRLAALRAAPHGIDLGPLKPCLPERLSRGRRISLAPAPFLRDLERLRYAFPTAAATRSEGLVLVGRRGLRDDNSWMHNAPSLATGRPRCTLLMNPEDARPLGLADGDGVKVASGVGAITVAVELTEDIMRGVVSLPHGYGHGRDGARLSTAARIAGASVNDITDDARLDALCGTAAFGGTPVTVSPARPASEAADGAPP
jgi:anaerobic selenocysteine-containing dehydrogenase